MKETEEDEEIEVGGNMEDGFTLLGSSNDKQDDNIHKKITSLVNDFVKNMGIMLNDDKNNSPSQFAQTIWDEFVKFFGEVNKFLKYEDITLKMAATLREDLKNFEVLFNFMREFGKIKKVSLRQLESIMDSIKNGNGSFIETIANQIANKLKNIEKNNMSINNNSKVPDVVFQSAEDLIKLQNDNDQGALEFLFTNWGNFAKKFNVGFNEYFNDKFESNPKWFGTLAKEVLEVNGGAFGNNVLSSLLNTCVIFENNQKPKEVIDYKSGHIKDVLDFLRNAKEKCGYEESKASEDEKQFAKKLFKWCDDVLEGYSKRRKIEIKKELEKKKKEKLKLKLQKEQKKIEKEKDVYISETQRHLYETTRCFNSKDEVGAYKHLRKAFDLLCLLAESEITNNKSDKKGLKGWYIDEAKKVDKYKNEEILNAICKISNKKYQNKGFLGFGKSRLTKIYKEIEKICDVCKSLYPEVIDP